MEVYPVKPYPAPVIEDRSAFLTLVSTSESGIEQRRRKWDQPKYSWRLSYELRKEDWATIWEFYEDRCGAYEPFWLPSFRDDARVGSFAAVGETSILVPVVKPWMFTAERNKHGNFFYTWVGGGTHQIYDIKYWATVGHHRLYFVPGLPADQPENSRIDVLYKARFHTDPYIEESTMHRVYRFSVELFEVWP